MNVCSYLHSENIKCMYDFIESDNLVHAASKQANQNQHFSHPPITTYDRIDEFPYPCACPLSLARSLALPLLKEKRRGSGRKTQIRISAQIHFRRFYTRRLCDDQIDSLLRSFSILNPLGFSSDVYTCIVNVFISHVIFLVPNRSRIPVTDWIRTTGYNSCDSRSQINNKNRKWFLFSFCYSFFVLRSFSFFIHSFDVQYIRTTRIRKTIFLHVSTSNPDKTDSIWNVWWWHPSTNQLFLVPSLYFEKKQNSEQRKIGTMLTSRTRFYRVLRSVACNWDDFFRNYCRNQPFRTWTENNGKITRIAPQEKRICEKSWWLD